MADPHILIANAPGVGSRTPGVAIRLSAEEPARRGSAVRTGITYILK